MANSGYDGKVLTCHSREGEHRLKSLVGDRAEIKLIQGRFFKTRKERWQYLLSKNPDLELINEML